MILPRFLLPGCRRALLAYGRTLSPHVLLNRSARGAVAVARTAAMRSSAYRQLLHERGLQIPLRADTPLQALPVLHKGNTFGRFTVEELAGPLHPADLADVLTSSGRGGTTFGIRLSTRKAHNRAWFDIDLGLQEAFDIDRRPTLIVNCLPMGVVFPSRAATVANVSVREDMACAVLRSAGPSFAQTIVCTDPLFVNRLLDHADAIGLDWAALNTSMVLGEEVLVESQREYIAGRLGIVLDTAAAGPGHRMVASSFGIGELALNLLFETRETIALRRALRRLPAAAAALCGQATPGALPAIFCFNPLRCHVETIQPIDMADGSAPAPAHAHAHSDGFGELCFTLLDRNAVIALPRYATGDLGRLIDPALAASLCAQAGVPVPWLPMVALHGRIADRAASVSASGRAAGLSAEDVKEAIYADPSLAKGLTGAFRLQRDRAQGVCCLQLQARPGAGPAPPAALQGLAARLAAGGMPRVDVKLVPADAFHGRPVLDYERKFSYLAGDD